MNPPKLRIEATRVRRGKLLMQSTYVCCALYKDQRRKMSRSGRDKLEKFCYCRGRKEKSECQFENCRRERKKVPRTALISFLWWCTCGNFCEFLKFELMSLNFKNIKLKILSNFFKEFFKNFTSIDFSHSITTKNCRFLARFSYRQQFCIS
jgi:hypothetical protein